MRKIQLLFAGTGSGTDALAAALRDEVTRWQYSHVAGLRVRWGVKLPEDPFSSTAQGAGAAGLHLDGFLEMASEVVEPTVMRSLVMGVAARLGADVDPASSALVAGEEHTIFPGDRPVLLIYALRRLPALTHEQFCDHWLHRHAEFARPTQEHRGYRQFHADPEWSARLAGAAGVAIADIDGVAEASYADVADFQDVMSRPEVAADAMEDERRFIDHARSAGVLTAVHVVGL